MKLKLGLSGKPNEFYDTENLAAQEKRKIQVQQQSEFSRYTIPHKLFADALQKVEDCLSSSEIAVEPNACLVTGLPGTGKSTLSRNLIRDIEEQIPPRTIVSDDSIKKTKPAFYIKLDSDITTKRLAKSMLIALGGEKITGDSTDLTMRLIKLLATCETQLIILDEFHHLLLRGAEKTKETVCNWVKYLLDTSGVAILILGTPDCEKIIDDNGQLSRRVCFRSQLEPFEYSLSAKAEYMKVIKALNKAFEKYGEVTISPMLTDEHMALALYVATGGLMDSIRKLLAYMLAEAHKHDKHTVGFSEFTEAYGSLKLEGAILPQSSNKKSDPNPFTMSMADLTALVSKASNQSRKNTR